MNLLKFTIISATVAVSLSTTAQSTYSSPLPFKASKGSTVGGVVECNGKPVEGVIVSDGYEMTKTDKKGSYNLKSNKQNPQVFITAPSGYDVVRDDVVPQFWADFTEAPGKFERHDFRLRKVDNKKHAVIVFTDVHLANQRDDVAIFSGPYTETIRKEVAALEAQGIPVYAFNLGDASWDGYWYAHNFKIGDFRKTLNDAKFPVQLYSVPGNHDNDPHAAPGENTDFVASLPYQKAFGPRYYSQNIGGVHYIFLDNILYKNEPAKEPFYWDITTKRNYTDGFTPEQLAWLKKDLANVSLDTPVVVSMHAPLARYKGLTNKIKIRSNEPSVEEFLAILKPYNDVHFLSGHSHKQVLTRYPAEYGNIIDHNINGTCASWWRTRATGLNNICPDGTPAGYEVFTVDGPQLSWEHRSFEKSPGQALYAFDMNVVKDYYKNNGEMAAFLRMYPECTNYEQMPANNILMQIWAWDPNGKLEVRENGKLIPVKMVDIENPAYTLNYLVRNTVWLNDWDKKGYHEPRPVRMFEAQASTPDAPIEITWTDPFGKVTKSTLNRPAPFAPEYLNQN